MEEVNGNKCYLNHRKHEWKVYAGVRAYLYQEVAWKYAT